MKNSPIPTDSLVDYVDTMLKSEQPDEWRTILYEIRELCSQIAENEKAQAEINAVNNRDRKLTVAEKKKQAEIDKIKKQAAKDAYGYQLAGWGVQGTQIAATGALATLRAMADLGPIAGGILGGATVAAQTATWAMNKPEPPKFANGGVVGGFGGASMGGDNTMAHVRNGEMVLNANQQRELFDIANGTTNNYNTGGITVQVMGGNNSATTVDAIVEGIREAQKTNRLDFSRM